jgi:hypothetical protein
MPGSIKIDDGSGNYTILTNAGSLGSDKTITIPNETATLATTNGITVADQWRFTADQATNGVLTGWAQVTDTGTATIGSSMTQSSGIFTFPTTGIYLVTLQAGGSTSDNVTTARIQLTTDNSSYITPVSLSFLTNNSITTRQTCTGSLIVDVTDTSLVKVRFDLNGSDGSGDVILGSSTSNMTSATFQKIGET